MTCFGHVHRYVVIYILYLVYVCIYIYTISYLSQQFKFFLCCYDWLTGLACISRARYSAAEIRLTTTCNHTAHLCDSKPKEKEGRREKKGGSAQNHFSAFMNYVYDSTTMKMPSKPNATYMSDKAWALSLVEGRVKCHFIWFCCWSLTWGRYLLLSTSQVSTLVSSSWDDVRNFSGRINGDFNPNTTESRTADVLASQVNVFCPHRHRMKT